MTNFTNKIRIERQPEFTAYLLGDAFHREDGPAIEYSNGIKIWAQHNKHHRSDGPALECPDGTKVWWYHGEHIDCQSQEEFEQLIRLRAFW